ncbi:DNA helicase-2 / ATP-dependent DNA helicase PcrA [Marinobacter salarius]|jgi:DNA helicase-2/ATP-dependent DNA helicase PcrA|uniref:DNA 3'-5' helicase n=1 Tax=Marinobacter salarius TaxID=1420917 RepID=A0ABY1FT53_9GAMM|nr:MULTISPECIES: DNA helicase II [Marinobacter]KXJ47150.1 MAG: DNA helicase II [Marinobacter sp. Hex_13]MBL83842.1 DNA helicase II [Marinobacter sp.]MBS8233201.1 DNA helicase II [Marinobacter salarius]SFM04033.1 DNA helicase-2 / ATP-dependent DNA helicase PcrA [Marinobacter salarius]|tara:strand:+ start:8316 stop:10481 length:2166 start_codon:yes stop_codon:yes gene_type:complete
MDVSHIIDALNDAQREAVAAQNDHLLVLAGAGSGKTRVLVHRIAWLMQVDKVPPTGILAVTFTNKAAKEMRYRIEQMMNIPARGLWFGTFHGIAHRLLRAHYQDAGLPENFQVLDSDDQLRLIKRVMRELQIDESRWPPKQAQWFINGQKDEGLRAEHIQENPGDHFTATMLTVYRQYEKLCNLSGLVDFGELLLRSHELWLYRPELLSHYQSRFQQILVDEFQDTNTIQYAWLQILAGNRVPLTVVGDDDQSIYGWRGAKIENIQQYQRDFPNARMVRLEQNYRSTQLILKAANAVIANNQGRLGKELWTDGPDGEPISLYAAFNEQDEANYIADTIGSWVNEGNLRSESAILYRSNAQSRVLEESLIRQGIPYRVYGGLRFYDRQEIRNAIAYLRLVHYRRDDAAFERVVNIPARGIGAKSLADMRAFATERSISLWESAERLLEAGQVKGRAKTGLQSFMGIIERLTEMVDDASLHGLMKTTLELSGLKDYHASEKGEKGQARVENLEELVNALSDYEVEEGVDPLSEFIAQAALDAGEAQAEANEDCVQLMTLHSAKGLEFPLVFLAGVEEGLFPHSMSLEEPGRMEEERRLAYVGITRAMQKLVLTYAESRRLYGQEKFHALSRFVREIPGDCIQEVRLRNTVSRPAMMARPNEGLFSQEPDVGTGFSLGQRVRHPKFGEGIVMNSEGSGHHTRVQVNFDEGAKWLVLAYAPLEAC